jgi:hypothetical protein
VISWILPFTVRRIGVCVILVPKPAAKASRKIYVATIPFVHKRASRACRSAARMPSLWTVRRGK